MHRPTITRRAPALIGATLTGGLILALLAFGSAQAQTAAPTAAPAAQDAASPPLPPAQQAAPAHSQRGVPAARPERRRRTSYAACNRQSQNRGLSGGARRRFLVRCKLGYERPRAPAPAPVRQP